MTALDTAYLAGLLDGEGFIGLCSNGRAVPQPVVQIGMTHLQILEWASTSFGGKVSLLGRPRKPKAHKQCYLWRTRDTQAVANLLARVVPFLKIKKKAAVLVLDYCNRRLNNEYMSSTAAEEFLARSKDLNRKGPRAA